MNNKKRIPKEGCLFSGLRVVAFLTKCLGGLIALGGFITSISFFIKAVPDISSGLLSLDHAFALFGLTVIATYIAIPAGSGCVGIIAIGLGFLMDFLSSKPNEQSPIDKPSPLA